GLMGHGMAVNLLKAGHEVTVIAHRNPAPIEDLVGRGARKAANLGELAKQADLIMICVSNSNVVQDVIESLKPHLRAGQIILDMGTSDPAVNRRLASELGAQGVAFAEAPVMGGPAQAADGELGALVGAEPETLERIRPVLEALCASVSHVGPVGAGQTAKLISNYLSIGTAALISDVFNVARKAGVEWDKLYAAMLTGSGNSVALRRMIEPALRGDFDGYAFTLANAHKDMGYYTALAGERGLRSSLADEVMAVYDKAIAAGHGEQRVSRLIDPKLNQD
ncbi:MAG TPA: NAD(P)-dependent oxidoreductase, partial [Hyphomicrobiales bacterium]|nr:NAD(P)-dependent oxidoreductase [Hyphomicrobiales bacterium]